MKSEFLAKAADAYRGIVREYGGLRRHGRGDRGDRRLRADGARGARVSRAAPPGGAERFREGDGARERTSPRPARTPSTRRASSRRSSARARRPPGTTSASRNGFLAADSLARTVRMNPRYLVTPLKLADLANGAETGDGRSAGSRRRSASSRSVIAQEKDPGAPPGDEIQPPRRVPAAEETGPAGSRLASELRKLYRDNPQDLSSLLYHRGENPRGRAGRPVEGARALPVDRRAIIRRAARRPTPSSPPRESTGTRSGSTKPRQAVRTESSTSSRTACRPSSRRSGSSRTSTSSGEIPKPPRSATARSTRITPRRCRDSRRRFESRASTASAARRTRRRPRTTRRSSTTRSSRRASAPMATKIMAEQYVIRTLTEDEALEGGGRASRRRSPTAIPTIPPSGRTTCGPPRYTRRSSATRSRRSRTLETCVAKYPGTELAGAAHEELARLKR